MHAKTTAESPTHEKAVAVPNRLYNSAEARELLGGISVSKYRQLTRSGALKAVKQGHHIYTTADAIAEYQASLPSAVCR